MTEVKKRSIERLKIISKSAKTSTLVAVSGKCFVKYTVRAYPADDANVKSI